MRRKDPKGRTVLVMHVHNHSKTICNRCSKQCNTIIIVDHQWPRVVYNFGGVCLSEWMNENISLPQNIRHRYKQKHIIIIDMSVCNTRTFESLYAGSSFSHTRYISREYEYSGLKYKYNKNLLQTGTWAQLEYKYSTNSACLVSASPHGGARKISKRVRKGAIA